MTNHDLAAFVDLLGEAPAPTLSAGSTTGSPHRMSSTPLGA